MRLLDICKLLTFVLLLTATQSFSASPPSEFASHLEEFHPLAMDKTSITEYLAPRHFYRKFSQGIQLGLLYSGSSQFLTLGVERTEYRTPNQWNNMDQAFTYGLEFSTNNQLHPTVGWKWFCCLGSHFDLFYKLALGSFWKPEEGLATTVQYLNYHITAAIGVEDLLYLGRKIHSELELHQGVNFTLIQWTIGYYWGE